MTKERLLGIIGLLLILIVILVIAFAPVQVSLLLLFAFFLKHDNDLFKLEKEKNHE